MDFYEKWIVDNYKLFTDEILQVFLQTGDLSQAGYQMIQDKIKAEKQQQNSTAQATGSEQPQH